MNWLLRVALVMSCIIGKYINGILIALKDGRIRGSYRESFDCKKYMAFEGIPYAKPPIGNLRFEDPQPVEPWQNILEVNNLHMCLQWEMLLPTKNIIGNEDCLYLNVYVPGTKINFSKKLDVLFHIHAGAFIIGSPAMLALPPKLMTGDVIFVSINYRLGPLGFYSTGDGRGNYGLKDQVAALKWVQRNIETFGGNKDSITLCGVSAGAASVHLHYFSQLSKGLFHRAFVQSGLALEPWAVTLDPSKNAKVLATALNCNGGDPERIRKCLKEKPAEEITKAVISMYHAPLLPLIPFGPVLEKNASTSFLVKLPRLQMESKEVTDLPLVISMTMDEGTAPAAFMYGRMKELNEDWNKWAPLLFNYNLADQKKMNEVSTKIKEHYLKNQPITEDNYRMLVKACTHRHFHLEGENTARLHAKFLYSNVYFILMNYSGNFESINITGYDVDLGKATYVAQWFRCGKKSFWEGVGHTMDCKFYYEGAFIMPDIVTDEEEEMMEKLVDMLLTFTRNGKPRIREANIQPVTKTGDFNYLLIDGPNKIMMKTTNSLGPHEFWNSLGLDE